MASEGRTASRRLRTRRCCPPDEHRALLYDLELDAETDDALRALLPRAKEVLGAPEAKPTTDSVRAGAARAIEDYLAKPRRHRRRTYRQTEEKGAAVPWWAR